MMGDAAGGRRLLEESLALSGKIGTRFGLATQQTELAVCLLALGDPAGAVDLCREAIRVAQEGGEQWVLALAYRALGEALDASSAPREEADAALREALGLLAAIGARPELARTHASEGRMRQARGDASGARLSLGAAVTMFRELGMADDLRRAEEALAALA